MTIRGACEGIERRVVELDVTLNTGLPPESVGTLTVAKSPVSDGALRTWYCWPTLSGKPPERLTLTEPASTPETPAPTGQIGRWLEFHQLADRVRWLGRRHIAVYRKFASRTDGQAAGTS